MHTHLDKLYWKKERITKRELLEYYEAVSSYILPYLKDRPLVLHRYPEGIEGESFYQKEIGAHPSFLKTTSIQHEERIVSYAMVQNKKSLLYVANLGSIEMHPFNARYNHLDKADYLILDLDPEAISFNAVIETAQVLKGILDEMKLISYCKTSGSRGLHIYVPMMKKHEAIKELAYQIALKAHQELPKITSLERLVKNRQKKVYIDFLRNSSMQNVASAYSVRAKPGAPVSTPLLWKEVAKGLDPKDFTIKTVLPRFLKMGDLFFKKRSSRE